MAFVLLDILPLQKPRRWQVCCGGGGRMITPFWPKISKPKIETRSSILIHQVEYVNSI